MGYLIVVCHDYYSKHRIDAHIMFSLARGKVSESTARLAIAKEMMKVSTRCI